MLYNNFENIQIKPYRPYIIFVLAIKIINMKMILFTLLVVFAADGFSHPGRTAKDGCHYCRTNCAKWGVPKNQRHCHHHADPVFQMPVKSDTDQPMNKKPEIKKDGPI